MCGLHRAQGDEERRFLGLASKPMSMVSHGLASKPIARVCRFGPQNRQLRFGDLAHKITSTVSWFGPQNQVSYVLLVAPQNRREDEDGAIHAWRASSFLHLKASQARVSQSSLKSGGGTAQMVHVASSWMSHGDEAKDERISAIGCIRRFYLNFVIFIVLGHMGSLVIIFSTNRTPMIDGEDQAFSHPSPTP
jgi:hypothetical protein